MWRVGRGFHNLLPPGLGAGKPLYLFGAKPRETSGRAARKKEEGFVE